jgi:hypothetical protein
MLLLLLACVLTDEDVRHAFDPDGDGVGAPDDCAPLDATAYPGAEEIWYDGVDQDCDGGSDVDQDGDGSPIGIDCDDLDARAYPGAEEIWYDGVDQGCDGGDDYDQDGDGSPNDIDCDDSDARVVPGAEELCGDGVVNGCEMTEDEARAMCRLQGELSLAEADLRFVGELAGDSLGESVSSAGDIDGDGRADLLLGAHYNDEGGGDAGAAYVFLSTDELLATRSIIDLGSADLKLIGEQATDQAGAAVRHARDVDGDGRVDLVVGAPYSARGGTESGAVYLLLSSGALSSGDNSLDLGSADLILVGEDADDRAGRRLAIIEDVDEDGRSDLLIGASWQDEGGENSGAAYLLFGSGALASPDGTLSLQDADLKLLGEAANDRAGYSVASAGDIDGDGGAEILIGATHNDEGGDDVGAVYLLYSPELSALGGATLSLAEADQKLIGEAVDDIAGYEVDGAGDVDGDGYADLIVGAPWNGAGGWRAGAAYLLLSSGALKTDDRTIDLSAADVKFVGEETGDSAGFAVAGAGDADGDGQSDLLIGAHGQDRGGADAGTVYLLLSSGALSSEAATLDLLDADLKLIGVGALDLTGTSVAGAGDINGDGLHDLLMGAFSHKVDPESDETEHGAAYVIFGRSF